MQSLEDEKIKNYLETQLNIDINVLSDELQVYGTNLSIKYFQDIYPYLEYYEIVGGVISFERLEYILDLLKNGQLGEIKKELLQKPIIHCFEGGPIFLKTIGQLNMFEAMVRNNLTFVSGAAGSGKTFLSVVQGVKMYKSRDVKRIILVRPAIEAGESLGFLPGDLEEKVNPYLRPIFDSLYELMGPENVEKLLLRKVIEICPLAYMRGRTLNDAFVILDEAQNATKEQMKMFLTRIGRNTKVVVTGDYSQIDLKNKKDSGFSHSLSLLKNIEGIKMIYLDVCDVVRHPLVKIIIKKYEEDKKKNEEGEHNGYHSM